MSIDYDKFDQSVDLDGLKHDIEDAKENSGNYKEVPTGKYEVEVSKMELTESKKGDPMVTIWFKVLNGEYKGSTIFYNQVITQGFQIHLVKELVNALSNGAAPIDFESYKQFAKALLDLHEAIDGMFEYALEYGENKSGFPTFKITEVFELED